MRRWYNHRIMLRTLLLPWLSVALFSAEHSPIALRHPVASLPGPVTSLGFAELRAAHDNCRETGQLTRLVCVAAIENACGKRGFLSGFGPVEKPADPVTVSCLAKAQAQAVTVNLDDKALPKELVLCAAEQGMTTACKATAHRFCRARGFLSGYGPTQVAGRQARWVCLEQNTGSLVEFYDERLISLGLDVELARAPSDLQAIAAHRLCRDEGFATGFGIVEIDGNRGHARVTCLGARQPKPPKLERLWSDLEKAAQIEDGRVSHLNCPNCGLNSTRFTRPGLDGLAVSRHPNSDAGDVFSLGLVRWEEKDDKPSISHVQRLFDTSKDGLDIDGGKARIYNAYDPTSTVYRGATWVAFECSGKGLGASAGICMGKLENGKMDPKSAYVLVHTEPTPGEFIYSASVPKLVRHQGRVYLYWSQQKLVKGPYPQKLVSIQTKGVELFPDAAGRLLASNGKPYHSDEGVVVASGVDSFDIISDGISLYLLGGHVPKGCETPHSPVVGCYDMIALRAKTPLGENIFSDKKKVFPWAQSHEYGSFFFGTNGTRTGISAQFLRTEKNPGKLDPLIQTIDVSR